MNNLITLPVWRITPMLMGSLCVFAWLDNRCFGKDAPMLVIIDETVANRQKIAVAVRPGVEVVVVKQATDFIGEATRLLTERPDVTELHIVSHGEPGKVHLGRHPLTVDDVWRRRAELAKWFAGRSGSAAIFLYGCEVGAGREGEQFVGALKAATGAQVAASTNLTGSSRLGGDWALELATGDIATSEAFDQDRLADWEGILASLNINEVLFNPPSTLEDPNEYIEIRGAPNYIIPTNTYLVSVDGDNDTDPNNSDVGKIKNIFPLGGVPIGNNGFLILLQKSNTYAVNTNATKLQNNGSQWGWGNATESSIGHNGRKGGTNLVNASVTFLLITTPVAPSTNDVVDTDGDGVLDGVSTNWTVLDSVGILDKTTNTTDYAYGLINFKNTNGIGIARSGTIITNKWTANYVGRNTNNTTGYGTNDWVASDVLKGTAPNYSLNGTNTTPAYRVNASLNHIGGPNFGSSLIPGIKLVESSGSTAVTEGLTNLDTYTLELNSTPTNGAVVIEARADGQVQVSTNGVSFSNRCAVSITNANSLRKVYVRPIDDNLVEGTPHYGFITHAVTNTTDTFNYPTSSIIPTVTITITDNEGALLSEVDVNPPGSPDAPNEFVEIIASANAQLTNLYVLTLDGSGNGKGTVRTSIAVTNATLGSNGLLVIAGANHPYSPAAQTIVQLDPQFNTTNTEGALDNDTVSILLVGSLQPIAIGTDLDPNNTGALVLPAGAALLDAVGWTDGTVGDSVYGGVNLPRIGSPPFTPDAATRFLGNTSALSVSAWFYGELPGSVGSTTVYDSGKLSANAPVGASLTPGNTNNIPPAVTIVSGWSGVVGDPTNPKITFTAADDHTPLSSLTATVSSGNPSALPASALSLTGGSGTWTLTITPTNLCYDVPISVTVDDGTAQRLNTVRYSASTNWRTNAYFHMGFGDASTAVPIDHDFMLLGNDETVPLLVVSRTNSGLAIKQFDFTAQLAITNLDNNGVIKETDWEASTKTGDLIYWLASMSNGADGSYQPNRNRLIATRMTGTGTNVSLTYVGHYAKLREEIINWDTQGLHGKGGGYYGLQISAAQWKEPKSIDGFNLEGLTMVVSSDTNSALIGFRAPLVPVADRRNALLLPVTNIFTLVSSGTNTGLARFGDPIELDLGGRGIRSIERYTNGYLIVGGPPTPNAGDPYEFRLFSWSGDANEPAQELSADLSGLVPEGIVELPGNFLTSTGMVQLLSDNGGTKWYSPLSDLEDKDLPEDNFRKCRSDWVQVGIPTTSPKRWDANLAARTGTFIRGSGITTMLQSSVTSLDGLKAVAFEASGGLATTYYPSNDWTNTLYHYNAQSPSQPIIFSNPIASFGSDAGGTPAYANRNYTFKIGFGDIPLSAAEANLAGITFGVYSRQTMARLGQVSVPFTTDLWTESSDFLRDGIEVEALQWGLTAHVRPSLTASMQIDGLLVSQEGTRTEYLYLISGTGFLTTVSNVTLRPTLVTNATSSAAAPLYVVAFDRVPAWRSTFVDHPHFDGDPLPSFYAGKTVTELLTYSQPVTNTVSLPFSPSAYTNLDASPELRQHPVLDQLVDDMRRDPMALANYVLNEIRLIDAYRNNDDSSVNQGGLNRGAYATLMEGQGSPAEQCALLIYLLRRAGVPAVYVFPAQNGLKMLDLRLSKLLGIQFKSNPSMPPTLVPANFPWAAAFIGTNWVHLFPWLKDSEIVEGLNLYDYMPKDFDGGYKWARRYLNFDTNIMYQAQLGDTPAELFPRFVVNHLNRNYPGISIDDVGRKSLDRKHYYARWQDFPTPTLVTNLSYAVESLSVITNTFAGATNAFDSVSVSVTSVTNPTNTFSTGPLRTLDLHNRRFVLWYQPTNGIHKAILALDSFRPDTTNRLAFAAANAMDPTNASVLNTLSVSNLFQTNEDQLQLAVKVTRYPKLQIYQGGVANTNLPGLQTAQPFPPTQNTVEIRIIRKGDLVAICPNVGDVSQAMLQQHAEAYDVLKEQVKADSSLRAKLTQEKYEGEITYLAGAVYHYRTRRFRDLCERLHKSKILSSLSLGLSQFGAKRDGAGNLPSGQINLITPSFDIFLREMTYSGDGHMGSDDDTFGAAPTDSFYSMLMLNNAAQEHAALNQAFGKTNAVSTVTLLQLATQKLALGFDFGLLELNRTNFVDRGNILCGSGSARKPIKDVDPGLWSTITNAFKMVGVSNETRVLVTKGALTNYSGRHMAAMIFGGQYFASLLSTNINGCCLDLHFNDPASLSWTNLPPPMPEDGSSIILYYGNDGQYHERAWFADLLYGGDKYVDVVGAAALGIPIEIMVPASAAPGPDGGLSIYEAMPYMMGLVDGEDGNSGSEILGFHNSEYDTEFDYITTTATTVDDYYSPGTPIQPEVVQDKIAEQGFSDKPDWASPSLHLGDPVHVITGTFKVSEHDLVIAGSFPLVFQRNYSSSKLADGDFGYGWTINCFPYLTPTDDYSLIYAVEPNGSVVAYHQQSSTNWVPRTNENRQINNLNSAGSPTSMNMLKSQLIKETIGANTYYRILLPDGSKRSYLVRSFPKATRQKMRPYLDSWTDSRTNGYSFQFGQDPNKDDYGKIRRIQANTGAFIILKYNRAGHITEAVTGDGRRVQYDYAGFGSDLQRVVRPDGSSVSYEYGNTLTTNTSTAYQADVSAATTECGCIDYEIQWIPITVTNVGSIHQITKEIKPEGRLLINQYDSIGRVTQQWATVGLDLRPVANATFIYSNNYQKRGDAASGTTWVIDVFGHTNRYDYTNGLFTKITDPLNRTVIQDWYWQTDSSGGYVRSLKSRIDKRGLTTTFYYDGRGNILSNVVSGADLTGDGQTNGVFRYTYTADDRLLTATDPLGNHIDTVYDNVFPRLPQFRIRYASNGVVIATNAYFYTSVTNNLGYATNYCLGVPLRAVIAYGDRDAATNDFVYDGRGQMSQLVQYTGTADSNLISQVFYNDRGELVDQVAPNGARVHLAYDQRGSPISRESFDGSALTPLQWEYSYYNENGELTWSDGPRFDPEDYVWREYDGGGRTTEELHWRSRAKADGSGVEPEAGDNLYSTAFRHYDLFGNLVKAIDPNGNYQLMKYDVAGQLTELRSMGIGSGVPLAVESFGYEPGGQVAFFTNSLGGVTTKLYTTTGLLKQQQYPDSTVLRWTYDLNGRVRHEFLSNSNFWDIIYDDANRLVKRTFSADASNSETKVVDRRGNLVITTNAVGAVFTNAYDEFNRIKVSAGPPGLPGFSAQMVSTYSYNDGGRTLTVSNALGERTVTIFDALKRPLTVEVRAADNSLINKTTTVYATNYHSATIVKGTGAGAVTNKAFSDTFGKTVLVQYFPGSGSVDFTLNSYDVAGNLISTRDELNQVTAYAYDALNRLSTNTLPDSAQVVFGYNAAGAITNRLMPGGLTWSATYDSANRMLNEKLTGGAQTARTNTYQYYTGGAFVGRLKTVTDARSVVTTNTYDSLLRLTGVDSSGPQTEHRLHKAVVYDQRGLLTSINHYADDPSILESTTVSRNYDGYGQLVGEEVDISGLAETHFTNQWNSAGRRTQLQRGSAVPAQGQGAGATMGYGYRADGFLTSVTAGSQTYTFSYGDNGLLASRSTPFRTVTVNQRDGRGRLKQLTTAVGVPTPLVETLDWRADSTLDDYTATRSTFTDFRDYSYNVRGQLTNETLAVNAGQTINQAYQFDTDKLGALISAVQTGTRTNRWAGRLDGLKRVDAETNVLNRLAMRATGVAQGVASVDVKLDGTGVGVTLNSANFDGKWFADLDLSAGAHTLLATAHHSLGVFNPSATNTFSVAGTNDITTAYDNAGNVISRTFPGGRVQTFTWDGFGRLLQRAEKAGTTTNWVWRAVYDGLGRRVRTVFTPATNGVPNSQLSTTIDSWYDPLVEFLEVGVEVNGQRTWKVYGPDLSGAYGAMQGIGGAEGAIREIDGVTEGLLNDYFGNAVATISGGQVNWNAGRFDGYGPVQGNQAQPLSASLTVAQSLGWQGRWADLTGDYQMGVRPYSPMLRRFLSCDSLGHVGDWGLYGYARGNPVAIYDPDGRNPLDQISGFTYNKDTGAFTAYHDLPGGTPWVNWHSDGTAILPFLPTWGSTVYPFDYNWQTQELVDRLQHINMAAASFSRIFNPQPLPPPNDAINSGDMDFVYITGALSLTRLGFTVGESTTTAATDALTTSRFTIKQVGNYWVKEVNSQAPSFVQWWARGELDEQAVALEKLGDMAPRFIYENGKLVTRDAGEYVPGNFWQTWLEGTKRLGTPFNDIRPNNIGADGIIFDPAKHPIQQALEAMATAGLLSAGAYEAYNWLTGGNEDSGNGQMLQLNSGPVLSKH